MASHRSSPSFLVLLLVLIASVMLTVSLVTRPVMAQEDDGVADGVDEPRTAVDDGDVVESEVIAVDDEQLRHDDADHLGSVASHEDDAAPAAVDDEQFLADDVDADAAAAADEAAFPIVFELVGSGIAENQRMIINQLDAKNYNEPGWLIFENDNVEVEVSYTLPESMRHGAIGEYEILYSVIDRQTKQLLKTASRWVEVVDIDECTTMDPRGRHQCNVQSGAYCVNEVGDYRCECPSDKRKVDRFTCEPVNKCDPEQEAECDKNAVCMIEHGVPDCKCKKGFRGDGKVCEDIPECTEIVDLCPPHSVCIELPGSFDCKCDDGYEKAEPERRDSVCVNIDECARGLHNCSEAENRVCVDTPGSFKCVCKDGFREEDDGLCHEIEKPRIALRAPIPLEISHFDAYHEPGYDVIDKTKAGSGSLKVVVLMSRDLLNYARRCGDYDVRYELQDLSAAVLDTTMRRVIVKPRDLCTLKRDRYLTKLVPECPEYSTCISKRDECSYDCECPAGFEYDRASNRCVDRLAPEIDVKDPYVLYHCVVCNINSPRPPLDEPVPRIKATDRLLNGSLVATEVTLHSVQKVPNDPDAVLHTYRSCDANNNCRERTITVRIETEDLRDTIQSIKKLLNENSERTNTLSTTFWVLCIFVSIVVVKVVITVFSKAWLLIDVLSNQKTTWADFEEAWSFWLRVRYPLRSSAEITAEVFKKWTERTNH